MSDQELDVWGTHGNGGGPLTAERLLEHGHLLTVDQARERLATTEPIASHAFAVGGARFRVLPGWNHQIDTKQGTDLVDAFVRIGPQRGGSEFQLSKDAVLEATSICGLPKGYSSKTPSLLIEPQLNYWFGEGLGNKDFKLLSAGEVGAAFTRATISPFSNLRLFDEALAGVAKAYGETPVYVDKKMQHSLRKTHMRLVLPERNRLMERTGAEDDSWWGGLQVVNSLIGEEQTSLSGYLYRLLCTNGAIDTHASSGAWSRRSGGQGDDVYDWAREAVDSIFDGLEHSFDAVQSLADENVQGDVVAILRELFSLYKVPTAARERIIAQMAESENVSMYAIMQAITAAANGDAVGAEERRHLMEVGGNLPHVANTRCDACHRVRVG